jgi:hypothetical protein
MTSPGQQGWPRSPTLLRSFVNPPGQTDPVHSRGARLWLSLAELAARLATFRAPSRPLLHFLAKMMCPSFLENALALLRWSAWPAAISRPCARAICRPGQPTPMLSIIGLLLTVRPSTPHTFLITLN